MKFALFIVTLVSISTLTSAQHFKAEGRIFNKATGKGLGYANLRAENTTYGIAANADGNFEFELPSGSYKLIASCMGFSSDTLLVLINGNKSGLKFSLNPVDLPLPQVTVTAGNNPALEIMRRAIACRDERAARLQSYMFDAYTKGVIRANNDLGIGSGGRMSLGLNKAKESAELITKNQDSAVLKIKGIFENDSKGYFKNPDSYKELIVARKTSANLPPSVGALTGGRLIQDFYSDDIKFFDRPLPGPLSTDALKYYCFSLHDILAMDNVKVFRIYFEPSNQSDPGFKGYVYISDSTYNLLKVDVDLNRAANIGGLFERVNIVQQFVAFSDNFYMPIDYRLFIRLSYLGILKAGFELSSVMYNYKINEKIENSFFDMAVLTILPGADSRDSTYWTGRQVIPNTPEEIAAYRRIDSIRNAPLSFWEKAYSRLTAHQLELSDNLAISSPFGIYQYNRVEGHTLYLSFMAHDLFDKRLEAKLIFSNGFSDKRFKQRFSASYYLGDYRTYRLSLDVYNRLSSLFSISDAYSPFTSTVFALVSRRGDFRHYYYTKGFDLGINGDVRPFLNISASFMNHTDNSAVNNSNFTLFGIKYRENDSTYSNENPPVYETKINAASFGFNFDFRNYIEDGYFRHRVSGGKSFVTFGAGVCISNRKLLKSALDFISYNFNVQGEINTFGSAVLGFKLNGVYSNGPVPFQMQYALPGSITAAGKNFTFRTVGLNNMFGDRALTLSLEHNFRDEFFRLLRVPFISSLGLQMSSFFNAGWKSMSEKSAAIIPVEFSILDRPLLEAGFSIGHALIPVNLEFAWRLTHTETNRFRIGINTFIL